MVDFCWEEFLQLLKHDRHFIIEGQMLLCKAIYSSPFPEHTVSGLLLINFFSVVSGDLFLSVSTPAFGAAQKFLTEDDMV